MDGYWTLNIYYYYYYLTSTTLKLPIRIQQLELRTITSFTL